MYMYVHLKPNNNTDNTEDLYRAHIHPAGCSRRESRNTGASPFSFTISVLGSFTCITQHKGPTALRPIRRTKAIMVKWSCSRYTSAATGQVRDVDTHILTTPELEVQCTFRPLLPATLHEYPVPKLATDEQHWFMTVRQYSNAPTCTGLLLKWNYKWQLTWGQFHRAAKQRKLLTRNICLADFLGYQPNLHVKLMYFGW